jgi:hypothetical protein
MMEDPTGCAELTRDRQKFERRCEKDRFTVARDRERNLHFRIMTCLQ